MTFSMPGARAPDVVTQESLLLGAAERIGRIRQGRLAVRLHLSRLRPQSRQEGHIRIALRMIEPMVNAYRGQLFLLGNSDIVFLTKDANLNDVENMIYKLRALFSKDPLTFADSGDGVDHFCTWYDLAGSEYTDFLTMARDMDAQARIRNRERQNAGAAPTAIDAEMLGRLLDRLATIDVTRMIRRQTAIRITEYNTTVATFQEFFVSLAELQKTLAPDVNLLGNRWMFQHLSLTLDRRMLAALSNASLRNWPAIYGLNLNLATVPSREFADFAAAMAGHSEISVELQVLDILGDGQSFFDARRSLRDGGHRVAIDGLSELTLQFMDVGQFDADLYKLSWSPEMGDADHGSSVMAAFGAVDREKVLLARCDSEAAIQWGLSQGIQQFQGRYVDTMLAAYTMAICDKSAACTLGQCVARHGVLAGPPRHECGNLDMLDTPPVMRAPRTSRNPEVQR